jgi:sterol 3beta-glucosyltransferase
MGKETRGISLDIPDRFKDGDDAQEDVTAPRHNDAMSMNQSIFSMIARAGGQSQVDLVAMQEVDSGDSDDDSQVKSPYRGLDGAARLSRLRTTNDFKASQDPAPQKTEPSKHRRALSENKLLRSLPKLKMSRRKEVRSDGQHMDQMTSSQFLPPRPSAEASKDAPKSEQPSKANARATPNNQVRVEQVRKAERSSRQESSVGLAKSKDLVTLATRIQQIFEFEDAEEVISEYPCWLLQSILLQGYMYITQKHICFYAYIPKKHVRLSPSTIYALREVGRGTETGLTSTARCQQNRLPVQARTV